MASEEKRCVGRGVIAGILGGLVASWVMNRFIEGPAQELQRAVQTTAERAEADRQAKEQEGKPREDATMKTAAALAKTFTGRDLTFEQKKVGGPIVHYAFGALMGGLYGAAAEVLPEAQSGFGTVFGAALFAGADLVAVPKLDLSGATGEYPISALTAPFTAHLVYGATTELVRRAVRPLL